MKWIKRIAITIGAIITIAWLSLWIVNDPLPEGPQGQEADALAYKMLEAINHQAWDSTDVIRWSFGGRSFNEHVWDKKRHYAKVSWSDKTVWFDIDKQIGRVEINGEEVVDKEEQQRLITQAWHIRNNDAFWLNPVSKVFDSGTERRLITLKNGEKALLVSYTSGGSTPGDSYLWLLDEQGLPYEWRLWVGIIPIKGFRFSWENWITSETGVKIAVFHKSKLLNVQLENVQMGFSIQNVLEVDEFSFLEQL
jgi:hypothetical protein